MKRVFLYVRIYAEIPIDADIDLDSLHLLNKETDFRIASNNFELKGAKVLSFTTEETTEDDE